MPDLATSNNKMHRKLKRLTRKVEVATEQLGKVAIKMDDIDDRLNDVRVTDDLQEEVAGHGLKLWVLEVLIGRLLFSFLQGQNNGRADPLGDFLMQIKPSLESDEVRDFDCFQFHVARMLRRKYRVQNEHEIAKTNFELAKAAD